MVKKVTSKSKKNVLITGGSGFLGINLCRYLHNKGYKIFVLDNAPFTYPDMLNKITFIKGDIRDQSKVKNAMKNMEYVIHTAAALPLHKPRDIYTTDVVGTKIILEQAMIAKVKRTVHISSTAVYGIPDHHPLKENDRLHGVGPYGKAKVEAERVCEHFRKLGMCVPILRPKSFIGPERLGVMAIYYDWIYRNKNIPVFGSGNNLYQLLDVEDLCQAVHLCLTKPIKNVNDTFNIGAKQFSTVKEDTTAVIRHSGSKKRVIPIPEAPLIFVLRIFEALGISPLYKWVYETAGKDSFVSIEKAEKQLGFKPKYANKQALIRNYEWYIKNVNSFENKAGVSHRVPWKQGILKVVSWFF